MRPKAEIFFDAITQLREDIVEEAQDYRFRKKQAVPNSTFRIPNYLIRLFRITHSEFLIILSVYSALRIPNS